MIILSCRYPNPNRNSHLFALFLGEMHVNRKLRIVFTDKITSVYHVISRILVRKSGAKDGSIRMDTGIGCVFLLDKFRCWTVQHLLRSRFGLCQRYPILAVLWGFVAHRIALPKFPQSFPLTQAS
jgi:hypothetical protein